MDPTRTQRFEEMFTEHYAAVRGYALRRTSADAAQDTVAETFLVAWRRLDDVPEDALPWLLGVARRALAGQRRTAGRRSALVRRLAAAALPAPAPGAEPDDVVTQALARLRPGDREAITLVAWDGLTPAQAAAALGLPGVAFRVRLHRAKARLHRELQHDPRVHPAMTPVP